ncbi:Competence protein ComEC [Sphingomonas sp. EC-HK361]|nr:Competence protein ComEC [Sphingomonas sp. EC-HK361]
MRAARTRLERWLEAERDQLPLWLPVSVGFGTALWFLLPAPHAWIAAMLGLAAMALAAVALGRGGRAGRAIAIAAAAAILGTGSIWWRAEHVAAPVLAAPTIASFEARVMRVDTLPARDLVRVWLRPEGRATAAGRDKTAVLPPSVCVNIATADTPAGLGVGDRLKLRARLMPPPERALPGAYDFAQTAWFLGIGATGRAFAPIERLAGDPPRDGLRARLSRHIEARLPGSAGGIASALATGDTGAIGEDDSEAMRRAGLAHLLSVSGLHITAVVGLTMLAAMRLLALSPWLALKWSLPLVAAGIAAAAAIGYTLLTGSEVPTVRSCIAALMVLAAMALGREAITLRLVATGALIVLLLWPESLAGPSFQLSFAAVTAIVALHESPQVHRWFVRRDEAAWRRWAREGGSLLLTGLVVELALMPIAAFHFHKAGVYGALANIVAIPLTTFVVMPLEALALVCDAVGAGGPFWWFCGKALALLLWLAHVTADAPGSVAMLPAMPKEAFAAMVAGGLWLALWRTRWRMLGLVPIGVGAIWTLLTPAPDLLITGDGRHIAVRTAGGDMAMLRDRAGDYTRAMLAENGGIDGEPLLLSDVQTARCSRDLCLVDRTAGGRRFRILATRSTYLVPSADLVTACAGADIVVSERRLPKNCRPRWLKLDKSALTRTGGIAITLATGRIQTVRSPGDQHPWVVAGVSRSGGGYRRAYPARGPDRGRNAADHRRGWRDRGGPSRLHGGKI